MTFLSPKCLLSLALLAPVSDALLTTGKCHTLKDGNIQLKSNFERSKYVGRWFEQSKSADFPLEWGQICGTEDYFKRSDGNIQIHYRAYANNFMHWPKLDTASPLSCNYETGECYQDVKHDPPQPEGKTPNYLLVDTDYESYSIVYSCFQITSGRKYELLWMMNRTPDISDEDFAKIGERAVERGVPKEVVDEQRRVKQGGDCKYHPYEEPGEEGR
jgi:apolipoprotein D and lipocalin family protein